MRMLDTLSTVKGAPVGSRAGAMAEKEKTMERLKSYADEGTRLSCVCLVLLPARRPPRHALGTPWASLARP